MNAKHFFLSIPPFALGAVLFAWIIETPASIPQFIKVTLFVVVWLLMSPMMSLGLGSLNANGR